MDVGPQKLEEYNLCFIKGNYKQEIRNPKQISIPQISNSKPVWNIGKLRFRICLEIRY